MTLRVGFLGCGRVSQRHMEVFRDEIKDARVVITCDLVPEKARVRANELGAEPVFRMEEMLSRKDLDAVIVMTESGKHAAHALAALEAGKHVIVEKPAALLPDEVIRISHFAKEKGLFYGVIYQNRFNPAMVALKRNYDAGRFGKLVLATVRLRWCRLQDYYEDGWHGTWAMDGGVINQQAIHHIDALQWVCGEVDSVVAEQANRMNRLEAEDTTVALVKFANGGLGAIEASTALRPRDIEASISVLGEHGNVVIGGIALNQVQTWEFTKFNAEEDENAKEKYSQEVPTGYGLSHGPYLQEIVNRLNQKNITPPVSAVDATKSIALVHALYHSKENKSWVSMQNRPLSQHLGRK